MGYKCFDAAEDDDLLPQYTNGFDPDTHKCCNRRNCKGAPWTKILWWCGGAVAAGAAAGGPYGAAAGAAILGIDAAFSAFNGTPRECEEARERKENCRKNNCELNQYKSDPTCYHCIPKSTTKNPPPNDCK